jgi:5-methylcytosine-specific restriction endonuclease McrA
LALAPRIAAAVYRRDGYKCRYCGERSGLHPHHVVYKSHGGLDALNNLITLCHCCHIEGVHGGKLKIVVRELLQDNLAVQFIAVKNWKPS